MSIPEQIIAITLGAALTPLVVGGLYLSKKEKIVGTIAVMGFLGTFTVGAVVVTKYSLNTSMRCLKCLMEKYGGED